MHKNILILMYCLIVLFLSGCSIKNDNHINNDVAIEEAVSKNDDVSIEETQDDILEKRVMELKEEFSGQELPATNIYINEECGYKFEFPENWIGSYFVDDEFPECAVVRFYGESIRGSVFLKTFSKEYEYGLTMFFILSEEAVNNGTYDSVTLIGESRGINYYFATTTDASLSPLFGEGKYWFEELESEKQLVNKDCEKAKEMMEFYESRDNLSKAFMEI
ncbi:MAG: hypothetical protein IKB50_03165 [Clostridia bacterium]|nr:hypothetical protein [Clostridia bacterium]